MDAADKAARIVRTVVETLKPGFAVRLWTGERIGPASGPVLVINDQISSGGWCAGPLSRR
ncbi:hypothetical protein NKI49_12515 [Mesorhizobium sp. M0587]